MIAWPNTVLLTGPEPVVVDPGYQTQGDMLVGALGAAACRRTTSAPSSRPTSTRTTSRRCRSSARSTCTRTRLEIATPHARAGRGWRDRATERPLAGAAGEVLPGVRWIHTPGHTDGARRVPGARPRTASSRSPATRPAPTRRGSPSGALPEDHPRREEHLAAFRAIRDSGARLLIPGHNPPAPIAQGLSAARDRRPRRRGGRTVRPGSEGDLTMTDRSPASRGCSAPRPRTSSSSSRSSSPGTGSASSTSTART